MLVLFETPAGYALFKVLKEKKLKKLDALEGLFATPESAAEIVKLQAFQKFADTTEALAAAASMVESKMGSDLKKFLKKSIVKRELTDELGVIDTKLGGIIQDKLGIKCIKNDGVLGLMRGIRSQMASLIEGLDEHQLKAMQLGLGHGLGRYKLKFSPDKVDTMIVQAVGLLGDLDKQLNTYAMRVKEWYSWHFPELAKIVNDNEQFARALLHMGDRANAAKLDFSSILPTDVEQQMKEAAVVSMGTEISADDLASINVLATEVVGLMEYRSQLAEYLKNRMAAIAPNLTVMVGELVGAKLIAHAGSLMNLAKQPASTVQILGAEKALFRALKTKHATPKYGLIYHASLVGQAQPKNKGKISRVLAAKTALAIRVDALGDSSEPTIALDARATVEARLRQLEGGFRAAATGGAAARSKTEKYDASKATDAAARGGASAAAYSAASDVAMAGAGAAAADATADDDKAAAKAAKKAAKAAKKDKKEKKEDKKEKKDKKRKRDDGDKKAKKAKKARE